MKLILSFILCFGVFVACKKNTDTPEGILESKKMVAVLIDIHLLESQIPHLTKMPDSSYILYKSYEKKIFQKHKIDSTTYKQSYSYYLNNLQEFEKIYGQVIDSLVYRETTLNMGKPMQVPKKDSIELKGKDSSKINIEKLKLQKKRKNLILNS